MNKHLCDKCGKKIASRKGARIITDKSTYLFCRKCLREAIKNLENLSNPTPETNELLAQLRNSV